MEKKKKSKLLAHRGYTENFQENTYESFFEAINNMEIDGIEMDVCQTKDKKLICFHDINLKRLTGLDKNINQVNYSDIEKLRINKNLEYSNNPKNYKYSPKIIKFEKLLNLYINTNKIINIELKIEEDDSEFVKNVLHQIKIRNMQKKVIITSFNYNLLKYINQKDFLVGSLIDYTICHNDINRMNIEYPLIILDKRTKKSTLKELKNMGKIIGIYTLNSYDNNVIDNFEDFDVDYLIIDKLYN